MRRLELDDKEMQELINLMDHGVKHMGLSVATSAAILLQKIQAAEVVDDGFTADDTPIPPVPRKTKK